MNVSEYMVSFFEKKEIDRIFGVVGGAALWICKALNKSKYIKPVFTNHEQAAVMAADGWARIEGKPGVVFTINGPGMTNTVTGIAQAWVDSSPLILISGNSNLASVKYERESNIRQYGTQDVRADIIMQPITKKTYLVENPEDIDNILNEAYELAVSGRPGPVFIEVPINMQSAEVKNLDLTGEPLKEKKTGLSCGEEWDELINIINDAKRPLILAGQGIRLSCSVNEFREFVGKYQIPVVTSRMGIDSIESDNKLFVGRCGNHGSRPSHFAIETCDVMLVLGCRLAPNVTGYDYSKFSNQSYKILIDIDQNELKKKIKIDKYVNADIADFLQYAVKTADNKNTEKNGQWVRLCNEWKDKYPIMQDKYYSNDSISTYRVVEEISKVSEHNDLILSDTGSCCCIVAQEWQIKGNQRLFISGGLSAMGYWVTAMGLSIANKDEGKVICFVGDGALQMNIQEFATLVLYNIPVKLIVISNNGYQFVRMSQSGYGINPPFGTDVSTGVPIPDIEKITKAYGLQYISCDKAEDISVKAEQLYNSEGPCVLEIFVADGQEVCPRLKSVAGEDGSFKAPEYADLYPFLERNIVEAELERGRKIR